MRPTPKKPVKGLNKLRWLGLATVALIMLTLFINISTTNSAHAQTDDTATPAAEQTTTAPQTTDQATTTASADTTTAPAETTAPADTTTAPAETTAAEQTTAPAEQATPQPEQTTAPAETTAAPEATTTAASDENNVDSATDVAEQCVGTQDVAATVSDDIADNEDLCADQVNQLKALAAGALPPNVVDLLKQAAIQKIQEYGPLLVDKLDEKANEKQDQRIFWVAVILMGILPIATLLLFLGYPFVMGKKIRARVPNAQPGKVFRMYVPQAFLMALVILVLGGALTGVQFLTGRLLGGVTNPQLVLQKEALNSIIEDPEYYITNYTDIFVGFAEDVRNNDDPDKSVFDIVLSNAEELKDSPVVNASISFVRFVMPFLTYLSIISLGILVLLFLVRIRPEIAVLLTYPIEIMAAEYSGTPLPPIHSVALGDIPVDSNDKAAMRKVGQKLMLNEIKVVALFAVCVLAVAIALSFVLSLFFYPISSLLIDSIGDAIQYFLTVEGAANTLLIAVVILMLFVIETVALFLLSFTFLLGKLQDALRNRFAKRITWEQTGKYMGKQTLRFGWILVLAAIFSFAAPYGANAFTDWVYNGDKDPNWTVALLGVPIGLLILLNLGFWLLRGFKMFVTIFKTSAAKEFGLVPAKPKKNKKEAVVS